MNPMKKGKTASQAHVGLPEGTFEEEHGRKGFSEKPPISTIRTRRPHGRGSKASCAPIVSTATRCSPQTRRTPGASRSPFSPATTCRFPCPAAPHPCPFSSGTPTATNCISYTAEGVFRDRFRPVAFTAGDYLVIPRAVTYRIVPETKDNFFLIIQSGAEFDQPERGLLGRHALYDPGVIVTPEPHAYLDDGREWEVRIKAEVNFRACLSLQPSRCCRLEGGSDGLEAQREGHPSGDESSHASASQRPHDIRDAGRGGLFIRPRPLEEDPEALKVPFFHRNTDYDEFIFYHAGDFFSRDNIKPGMVTLHPRGIHHGPHPGALANQGKKTHTDEYAVMLDGVNPIGVLPPGEGAEWKEYWKSWSRFLHRRNPESERRAHHGRARSPKSDQWSRGRFAAKRVDRNGIPDDWTERAHHGRAKTEKKREHTRSRVVTGGP